jgi:hypothetical protein
VEDGLPPSMETMYVLMQQQMDMHVLAQDVRENVEFKQLFYCNHDIMPRSNL